MHPSQMSLSASTASEMHPMHFTIRLLPVCNEPIGADERSGITPCLCYSQRCRWCAWRGVRGCTCCLRLFFFACANARPFIYVASRRSVETDSRVVVRRDVERINAGDAAREGPAAFWPCTQPGDRKTRSRLARLNATPVPAEVVYG